MSRQVRGDTVVLMDEGITRPFTQRLTRSEWLGLDVILASFLFAISATSIATQRETPLGPNGAGWDTLRYVALTLACVPITFRRRAPRAALAVVTPAVAATIALGVRGPQVLALVFVLFTLAVASARRLPPAVVGAVLATVLVGALAVDGGPAWGTVIGSCTAVLVGWFAGENVRARRLYAQEMARRAEERERDREERVRQAATDERLRIARELHDIVAHAMSLIAVRAGAARVVADAKPDEARDALGIIETTSRRALHELRRLVGVLRDDEGRAELQPAPGLAELDVLVRETAEAGVHVDVEIAGHVRPLPPGVDVSAYRIAQEALTNVVRHAGPTNAHLRVRYQPHAVEIELVDEGAVSPRHVPVQERNGAGHGIVGMRERVALYHGELVTGPHDNGFRVLARLPIDDDSS
jgi:signal transduction histidine kinase